MNYQSALDHCLQMVQLGDFFNSLLMCVTFIPGKMRMRLPCRSSQCDHLQCFDAANYVMMNEKKDKWMCPVCNNVAPFDTLMLDGYFTGNLTFFKPIRSYSFTLSEVTIRSILNLIFNLHRTFFKT